MKITEEKRQKLEKLAAKETLSATIEAARGYRQYDDGILRAIDLYEEAIRPRAKPKQSFYRIGNETIRTESIELKVFKPGELELELIELYHTVSFKRIAEKIKENAVSLLSYLTTKKEDEINKKTLELLTENRDILLQTLLNQHGNNNEKLGESIETKMALRKIFSASTGCFFFKGSTPLQNIKERMKLNREKQEKWLQEKREKQKKLGEKLDCFSIISEAQHQKIRQGFENEICQGLKQAKQSTTAQFFVSIETTMPKPQNSAQEWQNSEDTEDTKRRREIEFCAF